MDLPKLSLCFIGAFTKSDCRKPSTYYYGCSILKPIKIYHQLIKNYCYIDVVS
uniref:Uncharacterized protein n=1 Tax=Romanomermis culicivorax TaxID=13658 RepID=A0A915HKK5_ROMCU